MKHLNKLEGALCQVTEVYSDNSDSAMKRHKHKKNFGCVIAVLYQVPNPTKLGREETNYKVLPKLLQMWIHLQTLIRHHQSKRDPLHMEQKTADVQRIGN